VLEISERGKTVPELGWKKGTCILRSGTTSMSPSIGIRSLMEILLDPSTLEEMRQYAGMRRVFD
jgi:hypothetical protein